MREQEEKWFDLATNCDLHDGLKGVCRLKQTCTSIGAARKYVTTITDVHILNYAVSLETCCFTTNKQGVWKCKLLLSSLPLQLLAKSLMYLARQLCGGFKQNKKSALFMSDLKKMPRQ